VESILINSKKLGLKPIVIGFRGDNKYIDYRGFLPESKYSLLLEKSKIGLIYYKFDCLSHYYGISNKVHQYIQSGTPVIAMNLPAYSFVEENSLGELFNPWDINDFNKKLKYLLKHYDYYLGNVYKYRKKICWKTQEKTLLEIYK
jgi:glycosyltransferase involved in cell wall biosynthesis